MSNSERLALANRTRMRLASDSALSALQARGYVRCLQVAWGVDSIKWNERNSSDQLADARRLIHAGGIIAELDGQESPDAKSCFRRAGELLEWLSRADDHTRLIAPIELLAASAFQLAGLPAMSAGLINQASPSGRGEQMFGHFLGGNFPAALNATSRFWSEHPNLRSRDGARSLLAADGDLSWYQTIELVRAVGLISHTLQRGDQLRLQFALEHLESLDHWAIRTAAQDTSLLIGLMRQVSKKYAQSTVFKYVAEFEKLRPSRRAFLQSYARRLFHKGRGLLWPSQEIGLRNLLQHSSFALCTPTGSGKTLVANFALVKELLLRAEEDWPLAIYIVPTRALATEVEATMAAELGDFVTVTGLYGGSDWGITNAWLMPDGPTVLITTVEKAEALMRCAGPLIRARLRLLIVDEAHQVAIENTQDAVSAFASHSERSIRLESFISRLLTFAPEISRIALTAVAAGASGAIAKWIEDNPEAESVGPNYRSTRQVVGVLETRAGSSSRLQLELVDGKELDVHDRIGGVFLKLQNPPMPKLPPKLRDVLNRHNQTEVLWTALHLASTSRRQQILISLTSAPERTMKWYVEALQLPGWEDAADLKLARGHLDQLFVDKVREACVDYCGPDSHLVYLLDHGIAVSYGQLPHRIRRLITQLIGRGLCPITIATATLTEGVNLPFDLILVPSLLRTRFDQNTRTRAESRMSAAEFRNLSGRAGRPAGGRSLEGITLVALPQEPSTTAPSKLAQQEKQVRKARGAYSQLRSALEESGSPSAEVQGPLALLLSTLRKKVESLGITSDKFLDWLESANPEEIQVRAISDGDMNGQALADSLDELDGVLLTAVEEIEITSVTPLPPAELEKKLSRIWGQTFTAYASVQSNWLEAAFVKRGGAISETIYPDRIERTRLYQYGYSPNVGRRFHGTASTILGVISSGADFGTASEARRFQLIEDVATPLAGERGFGFFSGEEQGANIPGGDWRVPLSWWLIEIPSGTPTPDDLRAWQRFVAESFEHRLSVAVGAVVSRAWSEGNDDPWAIPKLSSWIETTRLPWFGFWIRELLRWGTLCPFVAFALSQGLANTRSEAKDLKREFDSWLANQPDELGPEDHIDPQRFLAWNRTGINRADSEAVRSEYSAVLLGTDGLRGQYDVLPMRQSKGTAWMDPAGFLLAESASSLSQTLEEQAEFDFTLITSGPEPIVRGRKIGHRV